VEAETSIRTTYTKTPLISADVLTAVEKLQTRIKEALMVLEEDDERTEVTFEPMEHEQRHMV
jgi:hypothetical protein